MDKEKDPSDIWNRRPCVSFNLDKLCGRTTCADQREAMRIRVNLPKRFANHTHPHARTGMFSRTHLCGLPVKLGCRTHKFGSSLEEGLLLRRTDRKPFGRVNALQPNTLSANRYSFKATTSQAPNIQQGRNSMVRIYIMCLTARVRAQRTTRKNAVRCRPAAILSPNPTGVVRKRLLPTNPPASPAPAPPPALALPVLRPLAPAKKILPIPHNSPPQNKTQLIFASLPA